MLVSQAVIERQPGRYAEAVFHVDRPIVVAIASCEDWRTHWQGDRAAWSLDDSNATAAGGINCGAAGDFALGTDRSRKLCQHAHRWCPSPNEIIQPGRET